jgi:hypothetical protein
VTDMRKRLAAQTLARHIEQMQLSEIESLAKRWSVDISDDLEGELLLKVERADEAESLTALAKRSGNSAMIDVAKKLDALSKRADEQDAERAEALKKIERLELLARTSGVRQ